MRLSASDVDKKEHTEALPLFVCAPTSRERQGEKEEKKKLCILVSTFTYIMYGNHARADFQSSWLDGLGEKWKDAYPNYPSHFPKYGHSTYNFHTDGSDGIAFASHKR